MSVIAVGGGKGGVGRSLVASGLAVFIAQLGKKVLLVDGHPFAPTLASTFGVGRTDGHSPPWVVTSTSEPRGAETVVPNLRVLSASTELGAVPGVALRRPREIARVAAADQCVVDLGFGVGSGVIDAMLDADAMVLVTTPEPVAVEGVYRFLRHAYVRALTRALKGWPREQAALHAAVRAAGGPPVPTRLAEQLAISSTPLAQEAAWATLARLRARLVVNASRSRADLDLGDAVAVVARQRLGVAVEYLGHVEYDDAVVLAARRRRPLLVDTPAAKASRNLERIARRLVALDAGRGAERHAAPGGAGASSASSAPGAVGSAASGAAVATTTTGAATTSAAWGAFGGSGEVPGAPPPPTHYEVLAVDRGASDEEIRRAYRRMREIYSADSLAIAGLLTEVELAAAVSRIEEARDVLLDPARRRPYDLSITPSDELRAQAEMLAAEREPPPPPAPPPPDLTPETEFSGELLRSIREARGIDLKDVATRTKISVANLRAIEAEEYGALPAVVYLRGFVAEVAKFLRLDTEQVTRTYLRRYRRAVEATTARGRLRGGGGD